MRRARPASALLLLLGLLAVPTAALAANVDVSVGDDFFDAPTVQVQPGDSVTWRWAAGARTHNVVASPNQTESFRSKLQSSGTFTRTFPNRGRFTYLCEIHAGMRGAVEVGPPPFPDTLRPRVTGARPTVSGSTARVTFRLSERARVRVELAGPSRRIVTRIFSKGKRSVTFRRLPDGRYRAGLRYRDIAGNAGRAVRTSRFTVR